MINKSDSTVALTSRLLRIINKHSRIEEMPIKTGKSTGLTAKEVHCLNAIGQQEGLNIKGIGDLLGVSKSAASQMVGRLEKKGLATKDKAPDNDKDILTHLTETGWDAFDAHKEFHERHLTSLAEQLGEFPDTQLAVAAAILAVVESVVDERILELFGDQFFSPYGLDLKPYNNVSTNRVTVLHSDRIYAPEQLSILIKNKENSYAKPKPVA
eukprot:TRINITY_DN41303_c0_g1_i1.p2 TRINITY_DN41303_c0_g1~~TRINITY_DN41303_c0_g1_i1.p2  ORF type:complete len:212 (-),score=34.43 TRINITY_DN41303_c0_g1_i1:310-945(-)